MNAWTWAATFLLLALVPCGVICFRGESEDRLVGLEMAGVVATLELVLLCEGFGKPAFYDIPLAMAFLTLGAGVVFARFLQRWI